MNESLHKFDVADTRVVVMNPYRASCVDLEELVGRINNLINNGSICYFSELRSFIYSSVEGVVCTVISHNPIAMDYAKPKYDIVIGAKHDDEWFEYRFSTQVLSRRLVDVKEADQ